MFCKCFILHVTTVLVFVCFYSWVQIGGERDQFWNGDRYTMTFTPTHDSDQSINFITRRCSTLI